MQVRAVLSFFYYNSFMFFYTHVSTFISKYNYSPSLDSTSYQPNLVWKQREGWSFFSTAGSDSHSGLGKTSFFKENLNMSGSSKPLNIWSVIISNIRFLFFGFYTQTISTSGSIRDSLSTTLGTTAAYPDGLLRMTGITKSSNLRTGVFMKLNQSYLRRLVNFGAILLLPALVIFVLLYLLIIISYKCESILPNSLTLTLTNLTVILFSLYNSTTFMETSLVSFASSLVRSNYNNLETGTSPLKIQEKYFSKYENTYFTDKKCSDAWVNEYYLKGGYLFNGSRIEDFFTNQREFSTKFSLVSFASNQLIQDQEKHFFELTGSNPLVYKYNTLLTNLIQFNNLSTPQNIPTNLVSTNATTSNPLSLVNSTIVSPLPSSLWKNSVNSIESLEKTNTNVTSISESNSSFFIKNQSNLNKFFIEKSLYKLGGLDWVYYYLLPKTPQSFVYSYSTFVKWVLSTTETLTLKSDINQIAQLSKVNKLSEIAPLKISKKL